MRNFFQFKTGKTSAAFKTEVLQQWQNGCWLSFFMSLIFLFYRMGNYFLPEYDASSALRDDVLYFLAITFLSIGRKFIIREMRTVQLQFLYVTDLALAVTFVVYIIVNHKEGFSGGLQPGVDNILTSDFMVFCLLGFPLFFCWFIPVVGLLIILTYDYANFYGDVDVPKLTITLRILTVLIGCIMNSIFLEKMRRNTFERQFNCLEKEKTWKEILDGLPEGIIMIDKKKNIKYVNKSVCEALSLDCTKSTNFSLNNLPQARNIIVEDFERQYKDFLRSNSLKDKLKDRPAPPTLNEVFDILVEKWSKLRINYNKHIIFTGKLKTNKKKTLEIAFTLKTIDNQSCCLFILTDVTNRLLVDSLQETIEYKNRLLASVSHELRTPLNGNINFIQAAIDEQSVSHDVKENFLIPALRSAKYLLTIINDILDFSQIHANSLKLVPLRKSLVNSIQEAMQLIEIQAKKKNLELKLVRPSPDWDITLVTDHNRLIQVIANLLSNALKFTFKGSITVSIEPESDRVYLISVKDTGIGISKENQKKLFKSFAKIDLGSKNHMNAQGVGLGLVISNALAKMLGPSSQLSGSITDFSKEFSTVNGLTFESELGVGTTFSFKVLDHGEMTTTVNEFPDDSLVSPLMTEGHDHQPEPRHSYLHKIIDLTEGPYLKIRSRPPGEPVIRCACPEILIVDDDSFNLAALETIIKPMRFSVQTAFNGQEAYDLVVRRLEGCSINCKPYKMIFLDCNMPVMDGYECAKKLRALFEEYPTYKAPLIACTAYVNNREKEMAKESGMDDYCTKPVSKQKIQDLIRKFDLSH